MAPRVTPLLSVGIPAYNRPEGLERAVRSVLTQTIRDLEVVVSDDASPDSRVADVGERLAREDARVRFRRQAHNLGHVANFRWVLEAATGQHFMWLSDDDWIDPRYAEHCLTELRADPRRRLVCGRARYYSDGPDPVEERPTDLTASRPGLRVVDYFARVNMNGPLYGVALRSDFLKEPFRELVGGDWLLIAGMATRGHVVTLRDVHVHRSMRGLGGRQQDLARSFGVGGPFVHAHHVLVASYVWRDIVSRRSLALVSRFTTATFSAFLVLLRFPCVQAVRRLGFSGVERWLVARARRRRE
jgi:glycosyltransferase involved in cell wall biosynthesis